jgi:hypothetical protein
MREAPLESRPWHIPSAGSVGYAGPMEQRRSEADRVRPPPGATGRRSVREAAGAWAAGIRGRVIGGVADDPIFSALFALLAVVFLLPLAVTRILPLQDAPGHLAVVQIWRHLDVPGPMSESFRAVGQLSPYLTYYCLLRALGTVMSLEAAQKLLLAVYVVSLPASLAYTLARFGHDRRYSLLSFALVYNTSLIYGFIPNVIALPLFVLSLGLLRSYLDRPSLGREIGVAVLVLLVFLTHLLLAGALALAIPIVFFSRVRTWREVLRRGLFALPTALLGSWWVMHSMGQGRPAGIRIPPAANMPWFLQWTNDVLLGAADEIALLAVAASWLLGAAFSAPAPSERSLPRGHWALGVAGMLVLTTAFFLPKHTTTPVYHWATNCRFVVPALLLLLGGLPAGLRGRRVWVLAPGLAGTLWLGGNLIASFRQFDALVAPLDAVIAAIPERKRVLPLTYDERDGIHQGFTLRQVLFYYEIRKLGYVPYLAEPYPAVTWKAAATPHPSHFRPTDFDYQRHGQYYDYFLATFPPGQEPGPTFPGAGTHVRLVARGGRFAAYENVGPLRPAPGH